MKGKGLCCAAVAALAIGLISTAPHALAAGWCCCGLHADCDACGLCTGQGCCCCCGCGPEAALCRAANYNWNRPYAHSQFGQPVALVVPPTAQLQTNWGWGVGSFRLSRLDHQFGRNYPGGGGPFGTPYRNTPRWPQDTNQFGVYYVRGPW